MQYPSVYTLIVAGAPSGVPASLLSGLVAKASYVIAADSGAVSLEAAGLLPDILVGDMDSIPAAVLAAMEEAGVPLRQVPARKDFTDLELALDVARERGTTNLVLCGVTGEDWTSNWRFWGISYARWISTPCWWTGMSWCFPFPRPCDHLCASRNSASSLGIPSAS